MIKILSPLAICLLLGATATAEDHTVTQVGLSYDPPSITVSPGDTITCTATATDNDGGSDSAADSIEVDNTAPIIDSILVAPATVKVGNSLTCTAIASDVDGDSPTISYEWSSQLGTIETGATITITESNSDPGDTITCTATAIDPQGLLVTDAATATVENSAPVVSAVAISPNNIFADTTVSCTGTTGDADGDTPTESFAWTNTTTGVALGTASTLTLDPSLVSPGDSLECTLTATRCR